MKKAGLCRRHKVSCGIPFSTVWLGFFSGEICVWEAPYDVYITCQESNSVGLLDNPELARNLANRALKRFNRKLGLTKLCRILNKVRSRASPSSQFFPWSSRNKLQLISHLFLSVPRKEKVWNWINKRRLYSQINSKRPCFLEESFQNV